MKGIISTFLTIEKQFSKANFIPQGTICTPEPRKFKLGLQKLPMRLFILNTFIKRMEKRLTIKFSLSKKANSRSYFKKQAFLKLNNSAIISQAIIQKLIFISMFV